MPDGTHLALCLVAGVFLFWLLIKLRPAARQRKLLAQDILRARERAHSTAAPAEKARALADAGVLSSKARRYTAAAGFFVRAMREDPSSEARVSQAIEGLAVARPRLLERILRRRLIHLPWDPVHREALLRISTALAELYEGKLKDPAMGTFMHKLRAVFDALPPSGA